MFLFKASVISHPTAFELILYAVESMCDVKATETSTFSLTALHQMHGLRAYHHCGSVSSVYTEAFHGSCSLNSQIFFFLHPFLRLFIMRTHTITGLR